jgi:uncharacterized membrane protein
MTFHIALSAFAGTAVEFLETAAIAYALAQSGYSREALIGTMVGSLLVMIPAPFMWPLFNLVPVHLFQLAVGVLLLWLGLSWFTKSVYRQMRGESPAWLEHPLGAHRGDTHSIHTGFRYVTALVMAKSAAVEAIEICMIVSALALGSGAWMPAVGGAVLALAATTSLVVVLKGKLRHVPAVTVKLWTGVLLSAIGAFWIYEGLAGS